MIAEANDESITTPGETVEEGGEEEEEETISIEDEFRELLSSSEEIQQRVKVIASQMSAKKEVTGEDLTTLYGFLEGDVLSLIRDLVQATGAGLNDAMEYLSEEDADEEEEGDDLDEATIQIYATLQANTAAFHNLAELDTISKEQKEGISQMLAMNANTMGMIRENVGEEVAQRAAAWIEAAQKQAAGQYVATLDSTSDG